MTKETLSQVHRCRTTAETWTVVEGNFTSATRARIINTRIALATTKKGDLSIANYINKLCNLGDEMATGGKPIDDDDLTTTSSPTSSLTSTTTIIRSSPPSPRGTTSLLLRSTSICSVLSSTCFNKLLNIVPVLLPVDVEVACVATAQPEEGTIQEAEEDRMVVDVVDPDHHNLIPERYVNFVAREVIW
jgi:hypothetical protein